MVPRIRKERRVLGRVLLGSHLQLSIFLGNGVGMLSLGKVGSDSPGETFRVLA